MTTSDHVILDVHLRADPTPAQLLEMVSVTLGVAPSDVGFLGAMRGCPPVRIEHHRRACGFRSNVCLYVAREILPERMHPLWFARALAKSLGEDVLASPWEGPALDNPYLWLLVAPDGSDTLVLEVPLTDDEDDGSFDVKPFNRRA